MRDPASERAVLAGLCQYGSEAHADVTGLVETATFDVDTNQFLFECLTRVLEEEQRDSVDFPTILAASSSRGHPDFFLQPRERDHLASILRTPIRLESVRPLALRLRKLDVARQLYQQTLNSADELSRVTGDESIDEMISIVERPLTELTSRLAGVEGQEVTRMGDGLVDHLCYLMDNPVAQCGICSGFERYDRSMGGGFRRGCLDIIAARAKAGKSFMATKILYNVSSQGIPVFYADTEMSKKSVGYRLIAMMTGLDANRVERGAYGHDKMTRNAIVEAGRRVEQLPWYYCSIAGQPLDETLSRVRRWLLRTVGIGEDGRTKDCLFVYDYLKLMTPDARGDMAEYQAMGYVATALKDFANRHDIPILSFAQLNREGLDHDDVRALSQSDRISWFCTSLTYLKAKSEKEFAESEGDNALWSHKVIPVLSRFGPGVKPGDYVNLRMDLSRGQIEEGPYRSELLRQRRVDAEPVSRGG